MHAHTKQALEQGHKTQRTAVTRVTRATIGCKGKVDKQASKREYPDYLCVHRIHHTWLGSVGRLSKVVLVMRGVPTLLHKREQAWPKRGHTVIR